MKGVKAFLLVLVLAGLQTPSAMAEEPSGAMKTIKDYQARMEQFNSAVDRFEGNCESLVQPLRKLGLVKRRMQAMALRGQKLSAKEKKKLGVDFQAVVNQFSEKLYIAGTVCGKDPKFSKVLKQM